jgi:hypothetical protein
MNTRHCLDVAQRLNTLLQRELGEGVDPLRLMHDPLYARDVLLVCQAHRNRELQALAGEWRKALTEPESRRPEEGTQLARRVFAASGYGSSRFGPDQPGFFHSQAGTPNPTMGTDSTGFGSDTGASPLPMPEVARRPAWYSPARWFGRR